MIFRWDERIFSDNAKAANCTFIYNTLYDSFSSIFEATSEIPRCAQIIDCPPGHVFPQLNSSHSLAVIFLFFFAPDLIWLYFMICSSVIQLLIWKATEVKKKIYIYIWCKKSSTAVRRKREKKKQDYRTKETWNISMTGSVFKPGEKADKVIWRP